MACLQRNNGCRRFVFNFAELWDKENNKTYPFGILLANKFVKIYSYCLYPFVGPNVWEEFAPHIWQTLWTRNFSKSTFDTTLLGVVDILLLKDSIFSLIFKKAWYKYHYKLEDLGEAIINLSYSTKPYQAYGNKITFYSSATIIDTGFKFPRYEKLFPSDSTLYNYSEFYFDNDRSCYFDKVEMKVYYLNQIGIIWIWVKHKTLTKVRTYQFLFLYNLSTGFGG